MKFLLFIFAIFLCFELTFASNPTSTPVWAAQFHTGLLVSNLAGSASPNAIAYSGEIYYNAGANASSSVGTLTYNLRALNTGIVNRLVVTAAMASSSYFQSNGLSGACAQWTAAIPSLSSLENLAAPSLNFWLSPTFLSDHDFKYIGVEYYRRGLIYFGTWHYQFRNQFVQVDYFHSIDYNTPFRLVVGWNPQSYYNSWNPIIVEFQTNYFLGFADLTAPQLAYLCSTTPTTPTPCSGQPAAAKPPLKSAPPATAPVAAPWPLQWNAQTSFTGNDFGTLTTSQAQIQLVGHFYYDKIGNRECNIWEDVTSGARSKTLIVDGQFHAITYATGACVEPPVPIHESLHNNWTQNLPFNDNRWLLRQTVHPDTGDFWLKAMHFAWDAFNAGAEHAFQYNQLPTGEPLLFQGPVYDFPPYLQSFSSWSGFTVGLKGLNLTNIYSVGDNCIAISPSAWKFIMGPQVPLHLAQNIPMPSEVQQIHQVFDLNLLRRVTFATLLNIRARILSTF